MSTTQILFIAFVLGMAGVLVGIVYRVLGWRVATGILIALAVWFTYVVTLSRLGILQRTDARPPGAVFILGPVIAYLAAAVIVVARPGGKRIAMAFPLALLVGLQAFRVIVELFLHQLYAEGVVPRMLTFSGANVDIYIGISAILVAAVANRHGYWRTIVLSWNVFGLIALANVVVRALLTAPGPLHLLQTETPNRMFGTFPFMFIPAFFVPLAVTLHLLAIGHAWSDRRS